MTEATSTRVHEEPPLSRGAPPLPGGASGAHDRRRGRSRRRRGRSRRRRGRSRRRTGAAQDGDVVGIHRHFTISRQGSTGHARAVLQGDARERENVSYELSGCADGRGAADLPKHVASCTAVDHADRRVAGRRERARHLENEDRGGVALSVESECSRQLRRRCRAIDSLRERLSTQVLASLYRRCRPGPLEHRTQW